MKRMSFIIRVWQSDEDGQPLLLASLQQIDKGETIYYSSIDECLAACHDLAISRFQTDDSSADKSLSS